MKLNKPRPRRQKVFTNHGSPPPTSSRGSEVLWSSKLTSTAQEVMTKAEWQLLVTRKYKRVRARIFKLPNELLLKIYNDIPHPAGQVAFSLSCKFLFKIAATSRLPIRSFQIPIFDHTMPYVHRHLMLDMQRWAWVPTDLRLCRYCWKFLPKQRTWKTADGIVISKLKMVDWVWAVKEWVQGGKVCPTCQIPDKVERSKSWVQCWPEGFARVVMVEQSL